MILHFYFRTKFSLGNTSSSSSFLSSRNELSLLSSKISSYILIINIILSLSVLFLLYPSPFLSSFPSLSFSSPPWLPPHFFFSAISALHFLPPLFFSSSPFLPTLIPFYSLLSYLSLSLFLLYLHIFPIVTLLPPPPSPIPITLLNSTLHSSPLLSILLYLPFPPFPVPSTLPSPLPFLLFLLLLPRPSSFFAPSALSISPTSWRAAYNEGFELTCEASPCSGVKSAQ